MLRWAGSGGCGWLADEAFRVCGVGGVEHAGPLLAGDGGSAVVDVGGGMKRQPGVAMFVVVPSRRSAGSARGRPRSRSNRSGKSGRYFSVLNCASLNGLSLETCGRAVRLGDAEIGEQERHRLGGHRRAAVGVDGQLVTPDALLGAGLADQHLGQRGGFAAGDHPADDVAGEDVQDHVQVVVGPLRRAAQLGDVPRPHLIRLVGDQFRFHGAGWVACRRGVPGSRRPGAAAGRTSRSSRGRRPSSSSVAHTSVGDMSTNRSLCSSVEDRLPLGLRQRAGLRPVRCGIGAGRCGGGLTRWRR